MFYNICLIVATIIAKFLCFVNAVMAKCGGNRGGSGRKLSKGGRQKGKAFDIWTMV